MYNKNIFLNYHWAWHAIKPTSSSTTRGTDAILAKSPAVCFKMYFSSVAFRAFNKGFTSYLFAISDNDH